MSQKTFNTLTQHPIFQKLSPFASFKENPLGFIDVGARGGAHELVEPIASIAAVLGFEPDESEYERMLQDKTMTQSWATFALEPIALADESADACLHLLNTPTNHSLRSPNIDFTTRYNMVKWREVGTWALKTELMDTILFKKRSHEPYWGELIKLDTQGTEYEILLGSVTMLKERTVAVVVEVAFCECYKDQKLFSEIELFLREHGFAFYGFHTIHSRSLRQLDKVRQVGVERAMYADAVFFKDPFPGSAYNKPLSTRQNYVLFVCALLLKYYDFALEIAAKTWGIDSPDEFALVKALVFQLSHLPHEETRKEVLHLANRINQSPENANIYAGKFSDKRRVYYDYDDVVI